MTTCGVLQKDATNIKIYKAIVLRFWLVLYDK